ncbi:MAG: carboxypeptidase regulatory-like domain-containing protein, partial [Thermoplasmata archaeon]|nr:carboxypeptidase regulatory-like domain-containing protein [Thermoplasmata archaeon]
MSEEQEQRTEGTEKEDGSEGQGPSPAYPQPPSPHTRPPAYPHPPPTYPQSPAYQHPPPPFYYPPPPHGKNKSDKPSIAGAMLVIVGILGIITAVALMASGSFIADMDWWELETGESVTVEGYVYDTDGVTPLGGVNVTISGTPYHSTTNETTGAYRIIGAPGGLQDIKVEKEGYNTIIHTAFLGNDGDQNMKVKDKKIVFETSYDFQMTPGSEEIHAGMDEDFMDSMHEFIVTLLTIVGVVVLACSALAIMGG